MVKGFIFDYNGTLVFDDRFNDEAWKEMFIYLTNREDEYEEYVKTHPFHMNKPILETILKTYNINYSEDDLFKYSHLKEEMYQRIAEASGQYIMVDGAKEFLDYIKTNGYKINMATASIKYNCDFYFKKMKLDNWFNQNIIAYDNGEYENKKKMYIDAAHRIGLEIKDCIVIEDSEHAIKPAIEAGCKKIIYMNTYNKTLKYPEIIQSIKSFDDIDKTLFE